MKKMQQIIQYLNAIAGILGEPVPIVHIPLMEEGREDPFQGQCALVIRKQEYMDELNVLYKAGKIKKTEVTVSE